MICKKVDKSRHYMTEKRKTNDYILRHKFLDSRDSHEGYKLSQGLLW